MKISRPAGEEQAERWTTCPSCLAPVQRDDTTNAYCDDCRAAEQRTAERNRERSGTTTERGYGWKWQKLSKRARAKQDFCSDCGAQEDLTTDHSMAAWEAHEAGKPITLDMVDVVCSRCNSERGPARGPDATDDYRLEHAERFARITADYSP